MKMSQGVRILVLALLLVAAVGVWYSLFFTGGKEAAPAPEPEVVSANPNPQTNPAPVTTSARALQVLPIPFLVTEAPEEVPLETTSSQGEEQVSANVPPNPFVPLRPPKVSTASKPQGVPESQQPVTVTPATELPAEIPLPKVVAPKNGAVTPPPVALGRGTLPVQLQPLAQEVQPEVDSADSQTAHQPEEPPQPPPNPLIDWARQTGVQLDGVALGPVSVAIFKTAGGYLALPVGQTFPEKDVLVKTITAERVLLVDHEGTNTLTLELGGGE